MLRSSIGSGGLPALVGTTNNPPPFTWATKPSAAANLGLLIRITDVGSGTSGTGGGTLWISNGTRWKLENNNGLIDAIDTANSSISNTAEQNLNPNHNLIPAGVILDNDRFYIEFSASKLAALSSATFRLRLGALGTVSDTAILATMADMTTTNQGASYRLGFKRINSTTIQRLGNGNTTNSYSGATVTAAPTIAVSNLDSIAQYLSLTAQVDIADVVTIIDYTFLLASTDS